MVFFRKAILVFVLLFVSMVIPHQTVEAKNKWCSCVYHTPAPSCETPAGYTTNYKFGLSKKVIDGGTALTTLLNSPEECASQAGLLKKMFNACGSVECKVQECDFENAGCVDVVAPPPPPPDPGVCECKDTNNAAASSTMKAFDFIKAEADCKGDKGLTPHPTDIAHPIMNLKECKWTSDAAKAATSATTTKKTKVSNYELDTSDYKRPVGYAGPLPDCAFDGSCRDVNRLLELLVNVGEKILGLIGSFALVFFVYGGFMMMTSMGNAERVKKGRDILVAAVVGIIIAFSAYALIGFFLEALGVSKDFRM